MHLSTRTHSHERMRNEKKRKTKNHRKKGSRANSAYKRSICFYLNAEKNEPAQQQT